MIRSILVFVVLQIRLSCLLLDLLRESARTSSDPSWIERTHKGNHKIFHLFDDPAPGNIVVVVVFFSIILLSGLLLFLLLFLLDIPWFCYSFDQSKESPKEAHLISKDEDRRDDEERNPRRTRALREHKHKESEPKHKIKYIGAPPLRVLLLLLLLSWWLRKVKVCESVCRSLRAVVPGKGREGLCFYDEVD